MNNEKPNIKQPSDMLFVGICHVGDVIVDGPHVEPKNNESSDVDSKSEKVK